MLALTHGPKANTVERPLTRRSQRGQSFVLGLGGKEFLPLTLGLQLSGLLEEWPNDLADSLTEALPKLFVGPLPPDDVLHLEVEVDAEVVVFVVITGTKMVASC